MKPEPRMDAEHVGSAVAYMASLPLDANVLFMTVMATKMPFVGRGKTSGGPQGKIDTHGIEAKFDPPLARLVEQPGIEQRVYVRVHGLHVATEPPRGFADRHGLPPCHDFQ